MAQIPVGFPCGGVTTLVKRTEAEEGLKRGASELDMVMNIAAFKQGEYKTLIRKAVGTQPGIKASGGVASIEDGIAIMQAGANIVAMRRFLVEQLEKLDWPKRTG